MLSVKVPDRFSATQSMHHEWCEKEQRKSTVNIDERTLKQMRSFVAHNKLKKVALQIIARQISDETIERLRNMFLSLDKDHSGSLTISEVDGALEQLGMEEAARVEMMRVMGELDMDGSGSIDYTEFIAATIEKQHYLKEEVCRAAFHVFDVDGDGIISHDDLAQLLIGDCIDDALDIGMDEVHSIMAEVNEVGQITFEQFMQLMSDNKLTPAVKKERSGGGGLERTSFRGDAQLDRRCTNLDRLHGIDPGSLEALGIESRRPSMAGGD
jgi:calcium-dependent protein kinase